MISEWRLLWPVEINQYDITMVIHYDITMGSDIARDVYCEITMGNDIARDIHCDITMSNDVTMCTNHGITVHNEPFLLSIFCSMPDYDFIMGSM